MNNLIEIKLQVTPVQLSAIAQLLTGETPAPLAAIPAAPGPSTTAVDDQLTPAAEETASVAADAFAGNAEGAAESTATPPVADPSASSVPGDTPPPPAGVELAKGMNGQMIPWDARIHGAAKKTNADGTWRLKQGVDRDVLVPQVEAELLAAQQAGKPAETADASIPPAADTPAPAAPQTTAPAAVPPASAATPPPPATTPAPPAAGKPTTFAELLPLVTAAKAAGTLTDEKIAEASTALGLGQFGLIATRPDLIPQMVELLGV